MVGTMIGTYIFGEIAEYLSFAFSKLSRSVAQFLLIEFVMSLVEEELISIANAIKDSISLWAIARNVSMSMKNMILPPAPNATNGNSAMALAEVQFYYDHRYSYQKNIITIVIVLDTLESHSSNKRVGTLKFEKYLPCDLSKLMATYLLPPPIYNKGKNNINQYNFFKI